MFHFLKNFLSFSVLVTPLIVVHELGHYWAARLFGVKIESFSIGFGPTLWKHKDRRGTEWKVSAFLLGGYVKMFDGPRSQSRNIESISFYSQDQSLGRKSAFEKIIIALAGPFANYLFAFVTLSSLFSTVGFPVYDPSIGKISQTSVAYKNGIRENDVISKIQNENVKQFDDIGHILKNASGEEDLSVYITSPSGEEKLIVFQPAVGQCSWNDHLGFAPKEAPSKYQILSYKESFSRALEKIHPYKMIKSLKMSNFQGPIGISQRSFQALNRGWVHALYLLCALSIGLGFFNLLPLPILDGGVALTALFEGSLKRKISPHTEQIVQIVSFFIVILFFVSISWRDISCLPIGAKIGKWFGL